MGKFTSVQLSTFPQKHPLFRHMYVVHFTSDDCLYKILNCTIIVQRNCFQVEYRFLSVFILLEITHWTHQSHNLEALPLLAAARTTDQIWE